MDVLKHHNASLTDFSGLKFESTIHRKAIKWLLALNRCKCQFLVNRASVPADIWTHGLNRIRVDGREDVMYHCHNTLVRGSVVMNTEVPERAESILLETQKRRRADSKKQRRAGGGKRRR